MEDSAVSAVVERRTVAVVAAGAPAKGGIPSFARSITSDPVLASEFDFSFVNTTRRAVRRAGAPTPSNAWHAVVDAWQTWRVARRCDVVHIQAAPGRTFPLLRTVLLCAAARRGGATVLCHVHSARLNGGRPDEVHDSAPYRSL